MDNPQIVKALYDQSSGLGDETIQGPYTSYGKVRMFGLQVDANATRRFLCRYLIDKLDSNLGFEFRFVGDEVCLQVIYFKNRRGRNASFVWRSASFLIPVEASIRGSAPELSYIPVFCFASNMYSVISASEINGCYTSPAEMWSPNDIWTEDLRQNTPERKVFTLDTMVIPEFKAGAEQVNGRLFEVCNAQDNKLEAAPSNLLKSNPNLTEEPQTLVSYVLKQFPTARFPTRSCYQAIVKIEEKPCTTEEQPCKVEVKEHKKNNTFIRLFDYASHPINANFQFVGEVGERDGTTFHKLVPTFYSVAEGKFEEPLGEVLAYRTNNMGTRRGWHSLV